MFESIKNKFQFRFKDRTSAANILSAALQDFLRDQKDIAVFGIPWAISRFCLRFIA